MTRIPHNTARKLSIVDQMFGAADEQTTTHTAESLLKDPRLVDRIKDIIKTRGYAGDVRPPMIAYVAMTSRLLVRPLNVNFVAPSSTGKNKAINSARELMPNEAYYFLSAGSQRSLIYLEQESLKHRTVIYGEADSIPDEGSAASALRALAEDDSVSYDTVEKEDGKNISRKIRIEGPIGLVTTSTKCLAKQMNTRVLEVTVNDSPRQTREVLRAQARAVKGGPAAARPDAAPFIELQQWLAEQGEHRVIVPFSEILADALPIHEVRMRRDFPQLLTVIQTSALLHQQQRERSEDGEIVATLDDYRVARWLLSAVFDAISDDGLTPAVRDTVEAIEPKETISQAELAERLGLSKATVSERVGTAVRNGWLMKESSGNGRTTMLCHGEPLPEAGTALPTVETVRVRLTERPTERLSERSRSRVFRNKNAKN